ncbi:MAG: SpoIIE family protein phosphatase, partial [Actinomycetota bacterium]
AMREIEDLYNNAPCGYHSLDEEGRVIRINDTELHWLGRERSQVVGELFADFLAPASRQVFLDHLPDLKARGHVCDLELELVRRDGSPLPVLWSAIPVHDAAGRFVMSRATLFDMTERKRSETVTRRQQQALLELAKDPVLASGDLARALRLVTETGARALGVARVGVWLLKDLPGAIRAADYYHLGADQHSPGAELSGVDLGSYLRALETERVLAADDVRTDPRVRELRDSLFLPAGITSMMAAPVRHSGRLAGIVSHDHVGPARSWTLEEQSFAGSIADLVSLAIEGAERREVEEALRGRSAAVEASMDGMAILNREGRYHYVNVAHAQLYGYDSPDQLLGKSWKALYAPDELRRFEEEIMPALARAGRWRGEAEGRRRDGALFPQELSLTALQDGGLICVVRVVTHRKRAEDELRFLAEAGEALTASLGYEETLQRVAQLVVSCMADICIIDMVEESGAISRVAVAHADPAKQKLAERLRDFPPDPDSEAAISEALRAGAPRLMPEISARRLRTSARNAEHMDLLRELGPRSALIQPLSARGRVLGSITLAYAQSPRRYGPQELSLAGELARRAAMAIDNARLYEHQKATAMTLQQSLLPAALPEAPGVEWAACYRPAGEGLEVGGDFYDVFPAAGDGGVAVVIGDVSGKGVGAATVTALTRHTARAVTMYDVVPSHVLSQLNHAIIQQGQGLFVTAIFAYLEPADDATAGRKLTFACGGHLPPLLLRPTGVVEDLGLPGMLLGFFPDPRFPDCETRLLPGDLVLFYTDGVTEARRQRELYGEERLAALLASCRGLAPRQVVERIEQAALDFQDGRAQDDIAILALRILPAETAGGGFGQD